MEWIDKVELACSLVIGAIVIVLLLHFSYSVFSDIRQAEWWERCRDTLCTWKTDITWFLRRMTGQVGEDE